MHIVCLCGSVRYKQEFLAAQEAESLQGRVVLAPGVFSKADGRALTDDEIQGLHALHRRKIELADELVVIAPDGRIGESTAEEIAYGRSLGKPVRFWEPDGQRAPIDPVHSLDESHQAQRLLLSDSPTPASRPGTHREDLAVEIMRQVVVFDAADLAPESDFWAGMVGGRVLGDDQFHCVFDAQDRWVIGVQLAPDHVPPDWPDGVPQQVHLDLHIDDPGLAHSVALALGARLLQAADDLTAPGGHQVYADPAGHPFCLGWGHPDDETIRRFLRAAPEGPPGHDRRRS